jgi:hypothetical protein
VDDIFEGDDDHKEGMRRLTPEQRGKMIMDRAAPRAYSWLTNPDGMPYRHEHEVAGDPVAERDFED